MIVLKLLALDDFYGVSETIDIAKGKHELCLSIKDAYKQYKRQRAWQKRR